MRVERKEIKAPNKWLNRLIWFVVGSYLSGLSALYYKYVVCVVYGTPTGPIPTPPYPKPSFELIMKEPKPPFDPLTPLEGRIIKFFNPEKLRQMEADWKKYEDEFKIWAERKWYYDEEERQAEIAEALKPQKERFERDYAELDAKEAAEKKAKYDKKMAELDRIAKEEKELDWAIWFGCKSAESEMSNNKFVPIEIDDIKKQKPRKKSKARGCINIIIGTVSGCCLGKFIFDSICELMYIVDQFVDTLFFF